MYVLENDKLAVHVLPELGGKITSLYLKEKEFELRRQTGRDSTGFPAGLHRPGRKRILALIFPSMMRRGLDDAFPNIDPGLVEWQGEKAVLSGSWGDLEPYDGTAGNA